jgi:hypothetical protein
LATWIWIVIAVAAVLVVVAVVAAVVRAERRKDLQSRFGPEYDRTVDRADGRRKAEAELRARERRREELDIRPLTPAARDRYAQQWRLAQEQFVDSPEASVAQADQLVTVVMRERGYPVDDLDRQADDISVDHPHLVGDYRHAQRIARASASGDATTEDLRTAMVHYRSLFDELLGDGAAPEPLSGDETADDDARAETTARTR